MVSAIKKLCINNVFLGSIIVLIAFCAADVRAMRMSPQGYRNAQYHWKTGSERRQLKQERQQEQERQQKKDFLENIKNSDSYKEFNHQLQEVVIAKGWFQGPSQQWKNQIIISAFDILQPYSNRDIYESQFNKPYDRSFYNTLYSHIKFRICQTIDNYDKKCYFHLYDPHVCGEIMTNIDGLIQYAVSCKKI
jgi:hypothetical protein